MSFKKKRPKLNIHDWEPDEADFNREVDRLLVKTDWEDIIILAWSSDEWVGNLIVAPEAVPETLADFFRGVLDHIERAPGQNVQPRLVVTQQEHCLRFDLAHSEFEGYFETLGLPTLVQPTKRGCYRQSQELKGHRRIKPQQRTTS